MRNRRIALAGVVMLALVTAVTGQQAPKLDFDAATLAWDRGDYVAALTAYKALLAEPGGEKWLEPIALQTGELYQTREITTDGANPRFSPDGRFVAYETGSGTARVTRVVEPAAGMRVAAEVKGHSLAFLPQGDRVVYLKLQPSEEVSQAQAELDKAGQTIARFAPQQRLNWLQFKHVDIVTRSLATGQERVCPTDGLLKSAVVPSADGRLLYVTGAREDDPSRNDIYSVAVDCDHPVAVTKEPGYKAGVVVDPKGAFLLYGRVAANPFAKPGAAAAAPAGGGRGGGGFGTSGSFVILDLKTAAATVVTGTSPVLSADGTTLAYVSRSGDETSIMAGAPGSAASAVKKTRERIGAIAVSPDGSRLAFQAMPKDDWEIFVVHRDGTNEVRVTREIQHDVSPRFVTGTLLVAATGESRHLRSSLYDLEALRQTRLFHNNTVRTIAPEYAWVPSADGRQVLVTAERDGDTVSPERGLYLVSLDGKVAVADVRARLDASLAAEKALRAKGERMFRTILADVKRAIAEVSTPRIFGYEKALFDFDSKHITKPGNQRAGEYLFNMYRSFGYEPEYQWFEPRGALGGKSANVIATLKGTENPGLVYVVSSHYDSVASGPGADDDSSGTAALLEAARVLAKRPLPATVIFASFTGEESGLLGSREFVRRAQESGMRIVGALNNDMIGWANDHRLDNTIRYSNAGIRDVQHAASFLTKLVTYDARYFKSTDAASYFDAYGDIVGGIGSYPVLGNPHYHQPTDLLETVNHELVAETSKVTVASIMLLASSPSPVKDLKVAGQPGGAVSVTWSESLEEDVSGYIVAWGPPDAPLRNTMRVTKPAAAVPSALPGMVVSVRAVNARGLEGWDWARAAVK
ncbi:MAG: M20/M25/M40 family metallo-hydrolase [Vicinamibacterales bacterium]|jgi:Tol biopolymer transport system component|nr:M20/M25/M40 family metallo-hydrolase [Vicinamibacterales bacterium]